MVGTTLRVVVDDLMKDFNQMFDDKKVQKSQVAYWVIIIGNRLLSQHIGKRDSGAFLNVFPNVPIEISSSNSAPTIVKGRKFIRIPEIIFDYNKDGGVEYISYYMDDADPDYLKDSSENNCPPPFTRQTFTRTTPSDSSRLYMSDYEKPNPINPYWYRVNDVIYFLGIECVNPKAVEIGIYSTIKPINDIDTNLDQTLRFPEELIIQLKRQVLDMGRFVMVMPEERVNDGIDSEGQKQIPQNKLTSVNELSEDVTDNK